MLRKPVFLAGIADLNLHGAGGKPDPLSILVVEGILLGLVVILGLNTLLTLAAQTWGLPFSRYALICLVITLAGLAAVIGFQAKALQQAGHRDHTVLVVLFLLSAGCAALALLVRASSTDTLFYTSNAVHFLDHPSEPMDFKVHFLAAGPQAAIVSPFQGTSLAYDYFRAVLARFLGLDYLGLFYFSGALASFTLPLIYYLLIYQFSRDGSQALAGTVLCLALVLLSLEGGNLFSAPQGRSFAKLAFWYSYYGKFSVMVMGIPLFVALSLKFFARPSITNWLFLSITSVAMVGMTAAAMLLILIFSGILFAAAILAMSSTPGYLQRWKEILLTGAAYFSSLGFPIFYAVYMLIHTRTGAITGDSFELPGQTSFLGHLQYFSSPDFLFTPLLMVISLVLAWIFLRGPTRRFVLFWAVLLIIFFLNPVSSGFMLDTLVPRNVYWRLFYLLPYPLAPALVLIHAAAGNGFVRGAVAVALLLVGLTGYGLVAGDQGVLAASWSTPHDKQLPAARRIAEIAPAGAMLAPLEVSTLVPMLDGFHPQVSLRPDAMRLWLEPEDAILRGRAAKLLDGDLQYFNAFRRLLNQEPVETVIFRNAAFDASGRKQVQTVLQAHGFVRQKLAGEYLIVWK